MQYETNKTNGQVIQPDVPQWQQPPKVLQPQPQQAADPTIAFTYFADAYDGDGTPINVCSWSSICQILTRHEPRHQQRPDLHLKDDPAKGGRLIALATFGSVRKPTPDRAGKHNLRWLGNVTGVTGSMLDFDGIPPRAVAGILARLDNGGPAYVAYSTWSDGAPDKACPEDGPKACFRVAIPFSRPVTPQEYETIWYFFQNSFPEIDRACKDATRMYYLPAHPVGSSPWHHVKPGPTLNVDNLLPTLPAAPIAKVSGTSPSGLRLVEITEKKFTKVCRQIADGNGPLAARFEKLVNGQPVAEPGERDDILTAMMMSLARRLRNADPNSIARHFDPQLNTLSCISRFKDPCDIAHKFRTAQAKLETERDADALSLFLDENIESINNTIIPRLNRRGIFQRTRELVEVVHEAVKGEGGRWTPKDRPVIREVPAEKIHELLPSLAQFYKCNVKGETVSAKPPKDLALKILARGEWADVPVLEGIVEWPIFRNDGSILFEPGYDSDMRVISNNSLMVDVSERPTREDAIRAIYELREAMFDFPFENEAAFASWVCTALTPFVRSSLKVNGLLAAIPMTVIDAPQQRTGKSHAAQLIGMLATGHKLTPITTPRHDDPDEWVKLLTGVARDGDPFLFLDNAVGPVKSGKLDQGITEACLKGRLLGLNANPSYQFPTQVLLTSNNAILSKDLVVRSIRVRLDANIERPQDRNTFRHPCPYIYFSENRARLVSACLTILRAYVVAGRPKVDNVRAIGGFEVWARWVRDAVVWAGLPDCAPTRDGLIVASEGDDDLAELFEALRNKFGEYAFRAKDLAELTPFDPLAIIVKSFVTSTKGELTPSARSIGWALQKHNGQVRGTLKLLAATHGNKIAYKVRDLQHSRGTG